MYPVRLYYVVRPYLSNFRLCVQCTTVRVFTVIAVITPTMSVLTIIGYKNRAPTVFPRARVCALYHRVITSNDYRHVRIIHVLRVVRLLFVYSFYPSEYKIVSRKKKFRSTIMTGGGRRHLFPLVRNGKTPCSPSSPHGLKAPALVLGI